MEEEQSRNKGVLPQSGRHQLLGFNCFSHCSDWTQGCWEVFYYWWTPPAWTSLFKPAPVESHIKRISFYGGNYFRTLQRSLKKDLIMLISGCRWWWERNYSNGLEYRVWRHRGWNSTAQSPAIILQPSADCPLQSLPTHTVMQHEPPAWFMSPVFCLLHTIQYLGYSFLRSAPLTLKKSPRQWRNEMLLSFFRKVNYGDIFYC